VPLAVGILEQKKAPEAASRLRSNLLRYILH
jgi:hypothetical protein